AARSRGADLSTQAGAVMGTPAYMAPEQARGKVDQLDERCDVFGLGAVLCVILTGQPPYTGAGGQELLGKAQRADLGEALARRDGCGASPELLWLAEACLAESPQARPRDAGAVARQLAAHLAGVQERLRAAELERAAAQARAAEAAAKAAAERRARRLTLGLAAALLLLVAGGGTAALWYQQQEAAAELRLAGAAAGVREALKEA